MKFTAEQSKITYRIVNYLTAHGFMSKRDIANDLNLSEVDIELALQELEALERPAKVGTRRDSYGKEVVWL